MKKTALLICIAFFLNACKKDLGPIPVDIDYVIRGEMVDSVEQKPISGVILYVNSITYDGFNIESITEVASDTTDSAGKFEIKYQDVGSIVLKLRYIPFGYQSDAVLINGNRFTRMDDHGPYGEIFGFSGLMDEGYYKIELIPN